MRTADFDYELPAELIAQEPIEPRDAARLLVLRRSDGSLTHRHVRNLPGLLEPGDLLVANRSRVLAARLLGRLPGGGKAEVLLLKRLEPGRWESLARPARRLRPGNLIVVSPSLKLRVIAARDQGVRDVQVESEAADPDTALLAAGTTPLPPYIKGWVGDPERYQTIFASVAGSAAAPTAGLHFTPSLLGALRQRGVGVSTILLHVGLDTFRPISVDDPRRHHMHSEWYSVPDEVQQAIANTRQHGGRVVAVGTTTVRALESWAITGATEGATDLFIVPGFRFQVVNALLTNFHLPRSTLLMLVSAFASREQILAAYANAIEQRYRFFSFGDAMLMI